MSVHPLPRVEISDYAKALLQIELEKTDLDQKSARLTADMVEVWERAAQHVRELSAQQQALIAQRSLLEEASIKLLQSRILP